MEVAAASLLGSKNDLFESCFTADAILTQTQEWYPTSAAWRVIYNCPGSYWLLKFDLRVTIVLIVEVLYYFRLASRHKLPLTQTIISPKDLTIIVGPSYRLLDLGFTSSHRLCREPRFHDRLPRHHVVTCYPRRSPVPELSQDVVFMAGDGVFYWDNLEGRPLPPPPPPRWCNCQDCATGGL